MGRTITEKIVARAAGREKIERGEFLFVKPDLIIFYTFPGWSDSFARMLKQELGLAKIPVSDKVVMFIDHFVPPTTPEEVEFNRSSREWAKEQGIRLIEGKGIGHQVAIELGLVHPGMLVVHMDTHVPIVGTFGALGLPLMQNLLEPLATGEVWLEVPDCVKINVQGKLPKGVMGRDLMHKIIADFGPDGALGKVIEFSGVGVGEISIDGWMSICCQSSFTGAISALVEPGEEVLRYLAGRTGEKLELINADHGVRYSQVLNYELSELEPYVVAHPSPGNALPLRELEGLELQHGYIGSCASGRLEDLDSAAWILKGKTIYPGFRLNIVPSSQEVMLKASRTGILSTLIQAGAFVSSPTCDYCFGKSQSLAPGERAISTGTLNVPGRMGSADAEIYLASAATVAASAIEGKIADARRYI